MSFPDRYHHDPAVNSKKFKAAKSLSQVNNRPKSKRLSHSNPGVVHSGGSSDYIRGYQF